MQVVLVSSLPPPPIVSYAKHVQVHIHLHLHTVTAGLNNVDGISNIVIRLDATRYGQFCQFTPYVTVNVLFSVRVAYQAFSTTDADVSCSYLK